MRILLLFLVLLPGTCVRAQSSQELIQALDEASSDGERYGILYELTGVLLESSRSGDRDLAINFSKRLYSTAKRMNDAKLAGPAAYTLALAYRNNRDERNTDRFMKEAVDYGMRAGAADLILQATAERTRLAAKQQNYREATRINQVALDYFTKNGRDNNIDQLRARLEREQVALQRRRREVEQQTQNLAQELNRLRTEKDQLEGSNTRLQGTNAQLEREKQLKDRQIAATNEELAAQAEELDQAQAAKAAVEKQVAESRREIKSLTREALEQSAIANETKALLAEEALNRQSAEMEVERQATQRNLALVAGGGLLLLALTFFSRFRVKQRSAKKLAVANSELDVARQQSDNLLENILPAEIAKELKTTGKARARQFSEATVLFCDFINFTQTAERLGAEALVQELDVCFKAFDAIVDRYPGVEKIKTIGDAYMVASGLTNRKTMPTDIVRAALEMQSFLRQEGDKRRSLGLPYFTGRIGLHTGPVVAGVVGARKFAYDIWGDTVNVASRIESQSEAGKVNVSETTYHLIRYRFKCTYRGKVEAKNKGMIDMYFVEEELVGVV
ncbi:MAG: adenylate/guanylate cyclase domain-containing protein [Bacteroidota bacterium]